MHEIEYGVVLNINEKNKTAKVRIELDSYCKHCASHSICPVNTEKGIEMNARNIVNAKPEEKVMLEYRPEGKIWLSFLMFGLPIIGLLIGYFLAFSIYPTENSGIIGSLVGFLLTFLFLFFYNKTYTKNTRKFPVIVKIITN